jgi:hypothetical protein
MGRQQQGTLAVTARTRAMTRRSQQQTTGCCARTSGGMVEVVSEEASLLQVPIHCNCSYARAIRQHERVRCQEAEEPAQVARADAVAHPRAVVIVAHDASVADAAVLASGRAAELAGGADLGQEQAIVGRMYTAPACCVVGCELARVCGTACSPEGNAEQHSSCTCVPAIDKHASCCPASCKRTASVPEQLVGCCNHLCYASGTLQVSALVARVCSLQVAHRCHDADSGVGNNAKT